VTVYSGAGYAGLWQTVSPYQGATLVPSLRDEDASIQALSC
jgi:hypothetical protein